MKRVLFITVGISQPSTVGAGMDLDSVVVERSSVYDGASGLDDMSIPLAILNSSQTEGVDSPFYSYFRTAIDPSVVPQTKRRNGAQAAIMSGAYGLGFGALILNEPPDTTPVTVGKALEIPLTSYAKRLQNTKNAAARATADAPGYWANNIPASSYNDISCRLLSEIQRHMLESVIDGGITWSLWTQTEVLAYLNERIVRFILETGLLQNRTTIAASAQNVDLPIDKIELRRVAWDSGTSVGVLTQQDAWALDNGSVGWQSLSGTPYAYVEAPLEPLVIQLIGAPSVAGTVDVLYVKVPLALTNACMPLPIPSFLTPYIKYGVMADMLMKQGEANDPQRAEYCESRFKEGVEMTKMLLGTK